MSKRVFRQKHVVCLGGGNAMPKAVLSGLKKYPVKISAVCAMLDTGGSAGRLRKDYGIVSPGDIRRAFLALANTSPVIEHLFNYRFENGQLKGHNLANLFITALELATNDYQKVLSEMAKNGLKRGENGLKVYVMCEIPNNVMRIDEFSELFDGFSIGSNELTQLVLGVDRDSALVAHDFDERDPGVMKMISMAIQGSKRNNRHCGLCGQAPSDYPEFAEFLAKEGIDSMSLNPDTLLETWATLAKAAK